MSNYIDPEATHREDIGPCRCPVEPKPHDRDWVRVVDRLGYGEQAAIHNSAAIRGVEQGYLTTILLGVKEWSLVLPDGSPRPIDSVQVARLDRITVLGLEVGKGKTAKVVYPGIMQAFENAFDEDPLPNESGALSPDGPSESASLTPTTPTPPAPTST